MQKNSSGLDQAVGCLESLAITAIFLLIGAALTWWGWTIVQNARASAGWPVVPGVITESELEVSQDEDGDDTFTPHVAYAYTVGGRSYESYMIKFGENTYGSERTAREILARYPIGQAVDVYYDPADPDRTALEPGVSGGSYIVLSVGVIFLGVSFLPPAIFLVRFFLRWR